MLTNENVASQITRSDIHKGPKIGWPAGRPPGQETEEEKVEEDAVQDPHVPKGRRHGGEEEPVWARWSRPVLGKTFKVVRIQVGRSSLIDNVQRNASRVEYESNILSS